VVEIQEFLKRCGIQVHKKGTGEQGIRAVPQYGFHSCRHAFITICRTSGNVSDAVIQSIVGNSYRLYTHVDLDSRRRAVEQMPWLGEDGKGEDAVPVAVETMSDEALTKTVEAILAELRRRKKRAS